MAVVPPALYPRFNHVPKHKLILYLLCSSHLLDIRKMHTIWDTIFSLRSFYSSEERDRREE